MHQPEIIPFLLHLAAERISIKADHLIEIEGADDYVIDGFETEHEFR